MRKKSKKLKYSQFDYIKAALSSIKRLLKPKKKKIIYAVYDCSAWTGSYCGYCDICNGCK